MNSKEEATQYDEKKKEKKGGFRAVGPIKRELRPKANKKTGHRKPRQKRDKKAEEEYYNGMEAKEEAREKNVSIELETMRRISESGKEFVLVINTPVETEKARSLTRYTYVREDVLTEEDLRALEILDLDNPQYPRYDSGSDEEDDEDRAEKEEERIRVEAYDGAVRHWYTDRTLDRARALNKRKNRIESVLRPSQFELDKIDDEFLDLLRVNRFPEFAFYANELPKGKGRPGCKRVYAFEDPSALYLR